MGTSRRDDPVILYAANVDAGLFVSDPGGQYIHLLYNSNPGGSLADIEHWHTREPGFDNERRVDTHSHFDCIEFEPGFDPFASWTGVGWTPSRHGSGCSPAKEEREKGCIALFGSGERRGGICGKRVKSDCLRFCGVHRRAGQQGIGRKHVDQANMGNDEDYGECYRDDISNDGSEGALIGDKADFEMLGSDMTLAMNTTEVAAVASVPERWAKRSLEFVISMMWYIQDLKTSRKVRTCCFLELHCTFGVRKQVVSYGLLCCTDCCVVLYQVLTPRTYDIYVY